MYTVGQKITTSVWDCHNSHDIRAGNAGTSTMSNVKTHFKKINTLNIRYQ